MFNSALNVFQLALKAKLHLCVDVCVCALMCACAPVCVSMGGHAISLVQLMKFKFRLSSQQVVATCRHPGNPKQIHIHIH